MKRALVTGITGQDGRYLASLLASKGYQVFGLIRGQNNPKAEMVLHETPQLELVDGDLRDLSSLIAAVERVQPDEVYNLGAISFVHLPAPPTASPTPGSSASPHGSPPASGSATRTSAYR